MTHQHTTSLEHSKKLAAACQKMGVEMPESCFWWHTCPPNLTCLRRNLFEYGYRDIPERVPYRAFTLGELMRMLPKFTKVQIGDGNSLAHYFIGPDKEEGTPAIEYDEFADTPENAACELLTSLILSGEVKILSV